MTMTATYPLYSAEDIAQQLPQRPDWRPGLAAEGPYTVTDISDGNLNSVYRVQDTAGASVILKQALPWARRYPAFILPAARILHEAAVLTDQARCCPEGVPAVLQVNPEEFLMVMTDYRDHDLLRTTIQENRVPRDAPRQIGQFLAKTAVLTSPLCLPSDAFQAQIQARANSDLVRTQEAVCFRQPLIEHPNNPQRPGLASVAAAHRANPRLLSAVAQCQWAFMTQRDTLLHGDCHTGSLLVAAGDTRFFDPEFAWVGPVGYDWGVLLAHLIMDHVVLTDPHRGDRLAAFVHELMQAMQQTFEDTVATAWREDVWGHTDAATVFWHRLQHQARQFAACELIRRTLGIATAPAWLTIEASECDRLMAHTLSVASHWLLDPVNPSDRVDWSRAIRAFFS